jgi:hypothetical protein
MSTPAEVIDLMTRRVRWLVGKNAELRTDLAELRPATERMVREHGPRPSVEVGPVGSAATLAPGAIAVPIVGPIILHLGMAMGWAGQQLSPWAQFDAQVAARIGPKAANVRRAIASLTELEGQLESVARSADDAQRARLHQLVTEANGATAEGRDMYNQWINFPSSRFDRDNTTLGERFFRGFARESVPGLLTRRYTGETPHETYERAIQPAEQWLEETVRSEAERAREESIWGVQATTGGKGQPAPPADTVRRTALGIRDKLAILGVASVALFTLYMVLKVKRAIPFV